MDLAADGAPSPGPWLYGCCPAAHTGKPFWACGNTALLLRCLRAVGLKSEVFLGSGEGLERLPFKSRVLACQCEQYPLSPLYRWKD